MIRANDSREFPHLQRGRKEKVIKDTSVWSAGLFDAESLMPVLVPETHRGGTHLLQRQDMVKVDGCL